MTVLLLLSLAGLRSSVPSMTGSTRLSNLAGSNLKLIMITWMIQQSEHPQLTAFDMEAAKRDMEPSFSIWTESRAAYQRAMIFYLLRYAPAFVVAIMTYLLVIAMLVGGRTRRRIVYLEVALLFVLLASLSPSKSASRLCPGTFAFLNDSVRFLNVQLNMRNPQRGQRIAAYDSQSFRVPGRRLIGFADGHVKWMWDEHARPLFESQGIPYPEGVE